MINTARKFVNSKPRAMRSKTVVNYRGYPVLVDGWIPVLNGEYVFVDNNKFYETKAAAKKAAFAFRDRCRDLIKATGEAA
jgi:hypothetical protein